VAGLTRRDVLRGAAVVTAAAAAGPAVLQAGTALAEAGTGSGRLALTTDATLHALRRLTYGVTPALHDEVRRLGVSAWLERQLTPGAIADADCDRVLAHFPALALTSAQVKAQFGDGGAWKANHQLRAATMARRVWSRRQLLEVMVEFWNDHLCVYPGDSPTAFCTIAADRDVIRKHALGRFSDLLVASAQSPAMLWFLDNAKSSADNLNENYGRELLELHTVGVDAGYTEDDVLNAARAMTGWSSDRSTLTFRYVASDHHVGPLRVLGWSAANATETGGLDVGRSLLSYLARHPATARHLATKLCRRLVSDTPPASLVESAAQVYLANDTAIAPVLRHIVGSPEFSASVGAKLRRPGEAFPAMWRAVGATYDFALGAKGGDTLVWPLDRMGHAPFDWRYPDGYADTADAWMSTSGMVGRWNAALGVAGGWWDGITSLTPLQLAGGASRPSTAGAVIDVLTQRLCQQRFPAAHRAALLAEIGKSETSTVSDADLGWKGVRLVALILGSPYFQVR
jgi:uncharacterized protein (DUF1800 family)